MREIAIEIRAAAGTADSILFVPDTLPAPGVIFLTDIGGIRQSQRDMARRIAGEGYTVLLPNLFYRTARPPLFDFPFQMGEERTTRRLAELSGPLTPEAAESDAAAYADFLSARDEVSAGRMGVVGLCFAGAMAMRTAAVRPDRIAAAATFHGGRLYTTDPSSPHLLLPRVKARLYFAHAVEDRSMPAEAIQKINQALEAWGGEYESDVYEGAYHSWTVVDSTVYNKPHAERAHSKLMELFNKTLR